MNSRISIWSRGLASINKLPQRNPPTPQKTQIAPPVVKPPPEIEPPNDDHLSVYSTSEAWPRKFKDTPSKREEKVNQNPPGRPRLKADQRRRNTISIAMSEEEAISIRRAAAERGVSISEWARVAMFKHMGTQLPKRDLRRRDWEKQTGENEE